MAKYSPYTQTFSPGTPPDGGGIDAADRSAFAKKEKAKGAHQSWTQALGKSGGGKPSSPMGDCGKGGS